MEIRPGNLLKNACVFRKLAKEPMELFRKLAEQLMNP